MIGITALVVTVFISLSTFLVVGHQTRRLTAMTAENLQLTSRVIIESLEEDMLQGQSGAVQKTITNISRSPEIIGLRIVSPDGYVLRSNNPAEIGYKSKDFTYGAALTSEPVIKDNTIILHTPIMNKPQCYGCHGRQAKKNGIVEIKSDFSGTRQDIAAMRRFLVVMNVLTVLVVALLLSLLFAKNIIKPIKALIHTMRKVEDGDFDAQVEIGAQGEFGVLADSFNRMIGQVKDLYEKNLKKREKDKQGQDRAGAQARPRRIEQPARVQGEGSGDREQGHPEPHAGAEDKEHGA